MQRPFLLLLPTLCYICTKVGKVCNIYFGWPIEDFELVTSGKQYSFKESELSCNQSGGELMVINFKEVRGIIK